MKIRGYRIDLSEIEKSLSSLSYVQDKIVLSHQAAETDQILVGFVILKNCENRKTEMEIKSDLRRTIVDYMIPKIIILDSFPLLINGKIDRQLLLDDFESSLNLKRQFQFDFSGTPENRKDVARVLFETIATVTGKCQLSINSNFYDIGGNSLNSVYTVMQLGAKKLFISISDFIEASNLGEILEKICSSKQVDKESPRNSEFSCHPLTHQCKKEAFEMISIGFYEKNEICQYLKNITVAKDYDDDMDQVWNKYVENGLCFIVKDATGRQVGVSLNYDDNDDFNVACKSNTIYAWSVLAYVGSPVMSVSFEKNFLQ